MSRRPTLPEFIPTAIPVAEPVTVGIPTAVPTDAEGKSLIPELNGRAPTRTESELMSGEPIAAGSSNVNQFWWVWNHGGGGYNPVLYVQFHSDATYYYAGVPLSVAVAMVQTDSHGRFVHNHLDGLFPHTMVTPPTPGKRGKSQVVRLVNR